MARSGHREERGQGRGVCCLPACACCSNSGLAIGVPPGCLQDVYSPGESRWEEEGDDGNDGGDGEPGSGGDGPDGPEGGQLPRDAAGRRVIPGIDMSSLD